MQHSEIISGKYFPVLKYLNETKGKFFPFFNQEDIAERTNTSVRSVRDYLSGKKINWNWLFEYANILNVNVNITVEDMFIYRRR